MTEDQQRRLARLMHYRTRYELVATHPTKGTYLVCYTSKKSFKGLTESMTQRDVVVADNEPPFIGV